MQPFDLKEHKVPHLKDLIHICLELEVQGCGMTFIALTLVQCTPISYHTDANGCIFFATVVCMFSEGNVYLIRLKLNFVLQMYLFDEGSITKLRSRMSSGTDFVILD